MAQTCIGFKKLTFYALGLVILKIALAGAIQVLGEQAGQACSKPGRLQKKELLFFF
jgi:hypothetical protein